MQYVSHSRAAVFQMIQTRGRVAAKQEGTDAVESSTASKVWGVCVTVSDQSIQSSCLGSPPIQ